MTVFDATTFGPNEVPAQINDYDGEVGYSYSECVLVDTYGDREGLGYNIGWFDFDKKTWFFKENSHDPIGLKEAKKIGLRWSFLPLAIYDTNPELRKTVKL